jgi:hypothetical protein
MTSCASSTIVRAAHRCRCRAMGSGLVSVAIPVKDMANYVADAIKSVLAQTYQNFEILVVDDGSTDGTANVVRELQKKDARIKLTIFPENKGQMIATNHMLEQAAGEYFTPLSADDVLDPTLPLASAFHVRRRSAARILLDADGLHQRGGRAVRWSRTPSRTSRRRRISRRTSGRRGCASGTSTSASACTARRPLRDVGGWREEYGVISDYAMYLGDAPAREHPRHRGAADAYADHRQEHQHELRRQQADARLRAHQEALLPPRRKLIIATPFYSVQGYSPYIFCARHTARALTQAGLDWDYWHPSGDAYVHRVKNTIFSKFIEDPEATDLLMIDSDMEWDVGGLLKMLMLQEELIVGSYPQKNSWEKWTSKPKFKKNDDGGVWAMQKTCPTAACSSRARTWPAASCS